MDRLPAWFVVFDGRPSRIWWHRLLRLRFKDCWAFGWDSAAGLYIVLQPTFDGFFVRALSREAGAALLALLHRDSASMSVLLAAVEGHSTPRPRLLGTCVTMISALLGLRRCCALTPRQLYRTLLARGAIMVSGS
jgi:hypothetical protein